ncbi:LysR family transcriptional regulator [Gluconobacter kanchanaburiensis]|uniref:LysR family transcriptional regulator n=1 Tax=Gluconobacter kanchanaburiensis NBRC 103587 TaxID=1307948 RepID=A0A511BAF6_9PROT|nr:LysR family transcriptional regulator [Gluconobacter kanchanaburiensis]MBF0862998.1 LysR family transcriptional regulator [Gluconobacter kanchanaburiensis]GBR70372.1 LysR family transcriptional regulator [Gluconobacter kanchanaburiensis NBRC 103587]GEK97379.1 LysR family transcriptional regulator [Gluconobacter kanchanaburiensis NBRC 103587]
MPFAPTGDFGQLTVFMNVAALGSFAAAGRKLGISGSAVGQNIRQLEQRLGLQLFVRTTRSVKLTPRGAAFLAEVLPAAEALKIAISNAQGTSDRPAGVIRLVAPRSAVEQVLMPMLPDFTTAYPEIAIEVTVDDVDHNFPHPDFDIALKIREVISGDMVSVRVGPELRQLAVAAPDLIARVGKPGHPRELIDFPCIRWRWAGHSRAYAWEFFENGKWFAVEVSGSLLLTDRQLALPLCLAGVGVCLAGETEVSSLLKEGKLINLFDDFCPGYPGWHLCFSRQRHMPHALRLFIDAMRQDHSLCEDRN